MPTAATDPAAGTEVAAGADGDAAGGLGSGLGTGSATSDFLQLKNPMVKLVQCVAELGRAPQRKHTGQHAGWWKVTGSAHTPL